MSLSLRDDALFIGHEQGTRTVKFEVDRVCTFHSRKGCHKGMGKLSFRILIKVHESLESRNDEFKAMGHEEK